jgi:acetolactate synthase regulatory subunit
MLTEKRWLLTCQLQERQGALDRFVGALSHRGLSILAMHGEMDASGQVFTATFEFTCADEHLIGKLVKALEKQITVLSAHCVTLEAGQSLRSGFLPELEKAH